MWVWQDGRVNSWLAGSLAGGWLEWCCCLVVETGSWCWVSAAAWWWKLEADADFSQCPNVYSVNPMSRISKQSTDLAAMMWVWQDGRVNSWLAGSLAGGWLEWCCCLVVETGSWCWVSAAAWWWKLEADADFSQCPNVYSVNPMSRMFTMSYLHFCEFLCNFVQFVQYTWISGSCRGVCSPCSLLIFAEFADFRWYSWSPSLGDSLDTDWIQITACLRVRSGYVSRQNWRRSQYGWHRLNTCNLQWDYLEYILSNGNSTRFKGLYQLKYYCQTCIWTAGPFLSVISWYLSVLSWIHLWLERVWEIGSNSSPGRSIVVPFCGELLKRMYYEVQVVFWW